MRSMTEWKTENSQHSIHFALQQNIRIYRFAEMNQWANENVDGNRHNHRRLC